MTILIIKLIQLVFRKTSTSSIMFMKAINEHGKNIDFEFRFVFFPQGTCFPNVLHLVVTFRKCVSVLVTGYWVKICDNS